LRATDCEDEIASWFDFTDSNPAARVNIGVLLGSASGIIDVEADNDAAKRVIKEHGLDDIPTCRYKSTRGEHHIFQYQGELPDSGVIHVGELEVRIGGGGKASQSVLPCSWHGSGIQYKWIYSCSPDELKPAPLPDEFLKAILDNSKKRGSGKIAHAVENLNGNQVGEGGRHAFLIGMASHLAGVTTRAGRLDDSEAETILSIISSLNETHCNPPKHIDECEKIVRDQWNYYKNRRLEGIGTRPLERAGLDYNEERREYDPGRWRLTVIHSDPKSYRLTIPNQEKGQPQYKVHIDSAKTLQSARDVANLILEQTDKLDVLDPDPKTWASIWAGSRTRNEDGQWIEKRSLRIKLLEESVSESPSADESEIDTAAEILLTYLLTFRQESGDDEDTVRPVHDGTPRWIQGRDGEWGLFLKVTDACRLACQRANAKPWSVGFWRRLSARWRAECDPSELSGNGQFVTHSRPDTEGAVGKFQVLRQSHLSALATVAGRV
jgi:hypothetical protein